MTFYETVSSWFRMRRRQAFLDGLSRLQSQLGRKAKLLDVGGVETFWEVMGPIDGADITIINLPDALDKPYWFPGRRLDIRVEEGSALDLAEWRSRDVDLVVSNSVIEHVGWWDDMATCAAELRFVAPHGWF